MTSLHCPEKFTAFKAGKVSRRSRPAVIYLLLALVSLSGCHKAELADIDPSPAIPRGAPPAYTLTAARHNRLAAPVGPVSCEATGTLRWTENGEDKMEQVDGRLFYGGPGRVHLAVRKLSQTLLIMGSGQNADGSGLYFAIDLQGKPRTMRMGSMNGVVEPATTTRGITSGTGAIRSLIGLARALDDVLAISPLPLEPGSLGGTQWSTNGHLLGVTYTRSKRGGLTARRWLSTDGRFVTQQTEVFAPNASSTQPTASILATARVLGSGVLVGGAAAPPPVLPESLVITIEGREAVQIELRLGEIKAESKLNTDLFDPLAQATSLGVERLIDLDASPNAPGPLVPPRAEPAATKPASAPLAAPVPASATQAKPVQPSPVQPAPVQPAPVPRGQQ